MVDKIHAGNTLLVANCGEIAVRILRTAKRMGLRTISVYTPADATSPHVEMADVSVPLLPPMADFSGSQPIDTESAAYLSFNLFIQICMDYRVTLLHPGYGFLSENAEFAEMVIAAGVTWLGPSPRVIRTMGSKHEARKIVTDVASSSGELGLRVVPGSEGLITSTEEAEEIARKLGFPLLFKPSAGGGGLGMVVCKRPEDVMTAFESASSRAKVWFR